VAGGQARVDVEVAALAGSEDEVPGADGQVAEDLFEGNAVVGGHEALFYPSG